MTQEALKLALEALEQLDGIDTETECVTIDVGDVIDAIKEALAQPEQEPVAWWNDTGTHIDLNVSGRGTPLYTTPPQRKLNERIKELAKAHLVREEHTEFGWQECHQYSFDEDELTEFADLIVRECADICMEIAKCAGLPGDGALAKDCADWIKKDFGVKND